MGPSCSWCRPSAALSVPKTGPLGPRYDPYAQRRLGFLYLAAGI